MFIRINYAMASSNFITLLSQKLIMHILYIKDSNQLCHKEQLNYHS